VGEPGLTPAGVIETQALTKRYPRGVTALDGLTTVFSPGITGLIGANGAGKSTLIKILLGLIPPTNGRASVLGRDAAVHAERIRTLTGYMPEHDCLPPDVTGTEFVTHLGRMSGLPATAAKERAAESLRHVGLHEERYRLIGTYSTGMKQRVKLAQTLVGDPRLLLLDEPTTGLDPAGMRDMRELVRRLAGEGITILLSSHLLYEVEELCNRVAIIRRGGIVYQGPLQELLATAATGYRLRALEPERARLALLAQPGITDVVLTDGDLRFSADEHAVAGLTVALGQARIAFTALVPETASLEELFLGLTGGESSDHDRATAVAV